MNEYKTWVCDECAGGTVCYHTSTAEPLLCTLGAPYIKWRELEDKDVNYEVGQHMIKVLTNESDID